MIDKVGGSSFFYFENPRQVKDAIRFQLNRLCHSLEKGESFSEITHHLKELKNQAFHLQNKALDTHLQKLESFLKHHFPLNEQLSFENLQTLKTLFDEINQETIF